MLARRSAFPPFFFLFRAQPNTKRFSQNNPNLKRDNEPNRIIRIDSHPHPHES